MKIMVDSQLVECKDEGTGPVIVLLHGWGANLGSFNDLAKELSESARVIRLDFPGFGGSTKPDDKWGVGEYSIFVGAFLKKLNVTSVYALIGHSFGGRVIIKGIATGELSAAKIVLLDTAGVKPSATAKKALLHTIAKLGKGMTSVPGLRKLQPLLRAKLYKAAGSTDYLDAQAMQKIFLNTINEDLLPYVPRIAQPTLLIWGEGDLETPVGDAYKILNELPNGKLTVVPGAGHFVYLDEPMLVTKELREFLS
jgi:pimeloyl-ACP methyl ester carboxylesterase